MTSTVILEQFISGFKGGQRPIAWTSSLSAQDRGTIYDACCLKESNATSRVDYTGSVSFYKLPSGKTAVTMVFRDSDEAGRSCPLWHTLVLDKRALESLRGNPFVLARAHLFSPDKRLQNPLPPLEFSVPPSPEPKTRPRLYSLGGETARHLLNVAFGEKRGFLVAPLPADDIVEEILLCLTVPDRRHFTFTTCMFSPEERDVKFAVFPPEARHSVPHDEQGAVLDLTQEPALVRNTVRSPYAEQICEMIFRKNDIAEHLSLVEAVIPTGTLEEKANLYTIFRRVEPALKSGDIARCLRLADEIVSSKGHASPHFRRVLLQLYAGAFSSVRTSTDFEQVLERLLRSEWFAEDPELQTEVADVVEHAMNELATLPELGKAILKSQEKCEKAIPGFDGRMTGSIFPSLVKGVLNANVWIAVRETALALLEADLWKHRESVAALSQLYFRAANASDVRYLSVLRRFVEMSLGTDVFARFSEEVATTCLMKREYLPGFSEMLRVYLRNQMASSATPNEVRTVLTHLSQNMDVAGKGEEVFEAIGKAIDSPGKRNLLSEAVWPWLSHAELEAEVVLKLSNAVVSGFLGSETVSTRKISILESYASAADASGRRTCSRGAIEMLVRALENRGHWEDAISTLILCTRTPSRDPYFSHWEVRRRLKDTADKMRMAVELATPADFFLAAGKVASELDPDLSVLFVRRVIWVGREGRRAFFRFLNHFVRNRSHFSGVASQLCTEFHRIVEHSGFEKLSGNERYLLQEIGALDLVEKRRGLRRFSALRSLFGRRR
jgi:hypothetical protein